MELYPGPGQYCPECGELLSGKTMEPEAAPQAASLEVGAAPEVEVASQAAALPEPQAVPEPATAKPARGRTVRRGPLIVAAAIVVASIVAFLAVGTRYVPMLAVRVCTSSMTDRVANEIVRTYSALHSIWPYRYTVTQPGDLACDVRFFADPNGSADSIFARDAVVVVVNPQNPIARLDIAQLRDILMGRITDWSQFGERAAPITAAAPDYDSDEAHEAAARVMLSQPVGSQVNRALTAAQIVRLVSSPSGVHTIGIVPFSVALPAKVLALGRAAAPSTLSIADGRYPLSVGIMIGSDFRNPSGPAGALLAFAHSGDANGVISRTSLVTKNGL